MAYSTASAESESLSVPVLIIGGGLSGLSAGARLTSLNIRFLLLEAQSHVGGRVCTLSSATSSPLELGATWFHGTRGNAAYDVAVSAGLLAPAPPSDDETEEEEDTGVLVCSAPGRYVVDGVACLLSPEEALPVAKGYASVLLSLSDGDDSVADDVSAGNYVRERVGLAYMPPLQRAVLLSLERLQCTIDGCDDGPEELSAARYGEYETLLGGDEPAPRGGLGKVVEALRGRLGEGEVRVNKEVTSVDWRERDSVQVTTRDGDRIKASCVIWSPGVNVTKAAVSDGVFKPQLPSEKVAALHGRGMGAVEKVFAVLGRPLDGVEANCTMPVCWADKGEVGERSKSSASSQRWQENVYGLTYYDETQTILFWLHGSAGRAICGLGEDDAVHEVTALLTLLYGQDVLVDRVVRSNWGNNRFTRGSYSFPAVGCEKGAVERLASPLPSADCPRLCFAGEATHPRFYSTMHGAIESGEREAERVAAFLKLTARQEASP